MIKTYMTTFLLMALGLTGCGKSSSDAESAATTTNTTTAVCSNDARVTAYADHMKFKGSTWSVELLSADPSPPGLQLNTWTFQVLDAQNNPVTGATVALVPWMPDHGHGPSVNPVVTASGSTYTVNNIDFFMPGVWQLTFNITNGGVKDEAVIDFCVSG